jgi:hypothetical protein
MLVAIEGISRDDLEYLEPEHGPIAWIVQHCCANVDFFIHRGITGGFCLEHEHRFRAWPLIEPQPGDLYPPLPQLIERWTRLLYTSIQVFDGLSEERLQEPSRSSDPPEPLVESCLRVINHSNAHIRQIWCILGKRQAKGKWPVQETWLA